MTYSEYYKKLTPIETKLFEEGYWEFHPPRVPDDALIYRTKKWGDLIKHIAGLNKQCNGPIETHTIITEKQIMDYLNDRNNN